ncbi:MAG: hypothetical protein ACWGOX_01460 [Desulforhopalus sp.]
MIRAIIAFLASILTAGQIYFISSGGKTLCFNDGCDIVDSMTLFSPMVFNVAGLLFFQSLFWLLILGRNGAEYWHKLARLLLLAGLAAEAVLIFFQYSIAGVFCSYCLVIFSFILLLNILCGLRQILRGAVLFGAVSIACFSLRFSDGKAPAEGALDAGTMAKVEGSREGVQLYLFFSATCGHCEEVIESLSRENICSVRFNPIEPVEKFSFAGAEYLVEYDPQINFNFMKSLSIAEVPVLVVRENQQILVLKGGQRIAQYLDENCREAPVADYSGTSEATPAGLSFLPDTQNREDDACAVDSECDPVEVESMPADK